MANPLKVLTALSASSGVAVSGSDGLKVQQGGLSVDSGNITLNSSGEISQTGGVVKVNGDLQVSSGHFKVGNNVESLIANPSTGFITAQAGFAVSGSTTTSGSLTVGGNGALTAGAGTFSGVINANGGILVNNAVLQVTNGEISGSSELKAGGAATLAGGVTVTGAALNASAVAVSASALNVTNAAAVGSLLVGGGFGSEGVTITTGGDISADGNITVGGNIVADANENKSIFAAVTSNTITIGASGTQISLPGTASVGGNLTIGGNLTVNGTTTTVSSQNVTIKDKNVILAVPDGGAAATDAGADGGGITLSGSTDKTFQWSDTTDSWTSSENLDLASGKALKLGTFDALKTGTKTADIVLGGGGGPQTITTHITGTLHVSGSGDSYLGVGTVNADGFGALGEGLFGYGKNGLVLQGGGVGFQIAALDGGGQGGVTIGAYSTSGETITLTGSAGSVTLEQLVTAVAGGSGISKTNYYSVRKSVVAHNNSGSTNDVIFHFNQNPAAAEAPFNGENWGFARITGLSGSSEEACLEALGYASIDVMTRDNGVSNWTNDLVSVKVEASSSSGTWYPKITVSAPALVKSLNTKIRMIVINDKSGSIG